MVRKEKKYCIGWRLRILFEIFGSQIAVINLKDVELFLEAV
jgi:hypothetical protein